MASWRPARVASPSAPNSRPGLRAQGGSPRRSLTFSLLLLSTTGAAGARAARPQPEAAGEFMRAAVSGGVAAAAATVALHPVDTIKTVLQQGGTVRLGGLYRGVVPAALSMMPACAVRMGAYETFKSQLLLARPYPALLTASGLVALSSALSVVVSAVVRSPLDMIKTQVQVGAAPTVQAAMRTAWQGGGLAAVSNFYRGAHLTLLRDVPFFTMNLVIYEELKAAAVKKAAGKRRAGGGAGAGAGGAGRQSSAGSLGSGEAVWLGAVAQGVAGFATNPVDVLKTRVQSGASPGENAFPLQSPPPPTPANTPPHDQGGKRFHPVLPPPPLLTAQPSPGIY